MSNQCKLCLSDNAEIPVVGIFTKSNICEQCNSLIKNYGDLSACFARILQRIEQLENTKEYKIILENKK